MEKHELIDINGNKTGKILTKIEARSPKNIPDGYYVSVAGVVIINSNNEVLLQRRSKDKKINPNKWGICGGKVNLGETTIEAGVRETLEEIGINLDKEKLNFLSKYTCDKGYYTIYYVRQNVDISKCHLQEEEVSEIKYFNIEELQNLDTEGCEWLPDLKKILF